MSKPNHGFINGVKMHREHPDTFEIPDKAEIRRIKPGDFIKVGAIHNPTAGASERFWVKVDAVYGSAIGNPKFVGTVSNSLLYTEEHGLEFGDAVNVTWDQILSVMPAEAAAYA